MGCGCNKNKGTALKWDVDFSGTSFVFTDGSSGKKTFSSVSEANSAISAAGATGKVRPGPSV